VALSGFVVKTLPIPTTRGVKREHRTEQERPMTKAVDRLIGDLETRARLLVCPIQFTVTTEQTEEGEVKQMTVTESGLDHLLRRVRMLLEVDVTAGVQQSDGYSSKTPLNGAPGSGKGGRPLMSVPGDTVGVPDRVPTSSTETAALASPLASFDPVHARAVAVTSHLRRLVHELEQLDAELGAWERMRMVAKVPDPPQCYIVGRLLGLPWDEYWEPWRTTTFPKLEDPQFDEPRKVCQWAYWFVRDHGRLPTKEEALKRIRQVAADRLAGQAG
jgi:hypothetical protein